MKPAFRAAMCGMVTALSVVLMFLGGVMYIFAYIVPFFLGVMLYIFKKTFKASDAFAVYVSTSVLSILFVPDKECALMFILFFGYYPLLKDRIDKIHPAFFRWVVKFLIFNASVFVIEWLCVVLFNIPFFDDGVFSLTILITFTVLMNVLFVFFEVLLRNGLIFYEKRLKKRLKSIFRMT